MAIQVGRLGDAFEAANKIKKHLDELTNGTIDSKVITTAGTDGQQQVQLVVNGQAVNIAGSVPTMIGGSAPVVRYGSSKESYLGIPGYVATIERDEGGSIAPGKVYDPYEALAHTISYAAANEKSILGAVVSGAGGLPGIEAASPTSPFSGLVQKASAVDIRYPRGTNASEASALMQRGAGSFSVFPEEVRRLMAYRSSDEYGVKLKPSIIERNESDPAKSGKSVTIGSRELAIPGRYYQDENGHLMMAPAEVETLQSKVVFPWEEEPRPVFYGRDVSMTVLTSPLPFSMGGSSAVRASKFENPYLLPSPQKFKLRSVNSVHDLTGMLSESSFAQSFNEIRGKALYPGQSANLGSIGKMEIVVPGRKSTYAINDASITIPKYYKLSTGEFATANEAVVEGGQLREGYGLVDVGSVLKNSGLLGENGKPIINATTTGAATPELELMTHYEVDFSNKTAFKSGMTPVSDKLGVVADTGEFIPFDAFSRDIKKPTAAFWSGVNKRSSLQDAMIERLQSDEARAPFRRARQRQINFLRAATERAGYNPDEFISPEGTFNFGASKGITGARAFNEIAYAAHAMMKEEVEQSDNPLETYKRQMSDIGTGYFPGGRYVGIPLPGKGIQDYYISTAEKLGFSGVYSDPMRVAPGFAYDIVDERTPEYYGKASLDLPIVYGMLSKGNAGMMLLKNLGFDFNDAEAGKTFAESAMQIESPGSAAWRSIVGGALITRGTLSGLNVDTTAVHNLDEEAASGIAAIMGATNIPSEERLQLAAEYVKKQGIDKPLLSYNGVVLPSPSVIGPSFYSEEGEFIGATPKAYARALGQMATGQEGAQQAAASYYDMATSQISSETLAKKIAAAPEVGVGFSGRYTVSHFLDEGEIYAPKKILMGNIHAAGYSGDEAKEVYRMMQKEGGMRILATRQPNVQGTVVALRQLTDDELVKRIMERTEGGISQREAMKVARAMQNSGIYVSPAFAEGGQGDDDKDPFTSFAVIPRKTLEGTRGLHERLKELNTAADSIFEPLGERMRAVSPAGGNFWAAMSEVAGSIEDYASGSPKVEWNGQRYGVEESTFANQDTSTSKMGMGMTYNARRTLQMAMDAGGIDPKVAQRVFRGTSPSYQYQLDLQAQSRAVLESLAYPYTADYRSTIRMDGREQPVFKMSLWGASSGGEITQEEIEAWKNSGRQDEAFARSMRKIYTQASGGIAADVAGINGPPTLTPFAAVGLLGAGVLDENELNDYSEKLRGVLEGDGSEQDKFYGALDITTEIGKKVGLRAHETPIVRTILAGTVESALRRPTDEKGFKKQQAAVEMLKTLNDVGHGDILQATVAGSLSAVIKKHGGLDEILLANYGISELHKSGRDVGTLTKFAASSYGITGVEAGESQVDYKRAPSYLSVRDLASLTVGGGFASNRASVAMRALQARLPDYADALNPSQNLHMAQNEAMRAGNEYEEAVINAQSGVFATQVGVSGQFGGTRVKGVIDYMRFDENGRLIIGDAKVSNNPNSPMYRKQVQIYGSLLKQTANDDEMWADFAKRLRQNTGVSDDVLARTRESLRRGDFGLELAHGNPQEISETFATAVDAGLYTPSELRGDPASAGDLLKTAGVVSTTSVPFSEASVSESVSSALGALAYTPTQELANAALNAVSREPNLSLADDTSQLLQSIRANGGEASGARAMIGVLSGGGIQAMRIKKDDAPFVPLPDVGGGNSGSQPPGDGGSRTAAAPPPDDSGGNKKPSHASDNAVVESLNGLREDLKNIFSSGKNAPPENYAKQSGGTTAGYAKQLGIGYTTANALWDAAKGDFANMGDEFFDVAGVSREEFGKLPFHRALGLFANYAGNPEYATDAAAFLNDSPATLAALKAVGGFSDVALKTIVDTHGKGIAADVLSDMGLNSKDVLGMAGEIVNDTAGPAGGLPKAAKSVSAMYKALGENGPRDMNLSDDLKQQLQKVKESAVKVSDQFSKVADVSKQLYEEFNQTGRVSRDLRERMKTELTQALKDSARAEVERADFAHKAAREKYEQEGTPEAASALSKAAKTAMNAQSALMKMEAGGAEKQASSLLASGFGAPIEMESASTVASKSMRSLFGGFGLFYMGHLVNMPLSAMQGGYVEEERNMAMVQQLASDTGSHAGMSTWEGRRRALESRQMAAYGPLAYDVKSVIGQSGAVGAGLMGGVSAAALTGYVAPSALRMTNALGITGVAADAIPEVVGSAMAWSLPIGATLAAGAYTYGVVNNPQSAQVAASVSLRSAAGTGNGWGNSIDALIYNTFKGDETQTTRERILAQFRGEGMTNAEAASYAASAWTLSDEEVSQYTEKAQEYARQMRYVAAASGTAGQIMQAATGSSLVPTEINVQKPQADVGYGAVGAPEAGFGYALQAAQSPTGTINGASIGNIDQLLGYERLLLRTGEAKAAGMPYDKLIESLYGGKSLNVDQTDVIEAVLTARFKGSLDKFTMPKYQRGTAIMASLPWEYVRDTISPKGIVPTGQESHAIEGFLLGTGGMTDMQAAAFQTAAQRYALEDRLGIETGAPPAFSTFASETDERVLRASIEGNTIANTRLAERDNARMALMSSGYSSDFARNIAISVPTNNLPALTGFASGNILATSWMANKGYLPEQMQFTDIGMNGELTGITTPFTSSMNFTGTGTANAEANAVAIWGSNWSNDEFLRGAVYGIKANWNPDVTLGGMDALRQQMSNLQYESQMASIGNATAREMLRWNFMTGGEGFSSGFSWHVDGLGGGSAGGGQWGYQDVMRQMQRAQQRFSFQIQEQRMDIDEGFYQSNYALNQSQFAASQAYTRSQWGLSDQSRALQWGWHVSDLEENMAFASGRERKLLERKLERDTSMQNIKEEGVSNQREYQEQIWRVQEKRYKEERQHHEEMLVLQKKEHETAKKLFEERARIEDQYLQAQRKFEKENHKLALAAIGAQAYYAKKMKDLRDDTEGLSHAQRDIMSAWNLATQSTVNAAIEMLEKLKSMGFSVDTSSVQKLVYKVKQVTTPHGSSWWNLGNNESNTGDSGSSTDDNGDSVPQSHVGGYMPAHSPRTLKEGEVIVMAGSNAYVKSEFEAQDPFATTVQDNSGFDASAYQQQARVEVVISSDDFREFVKDVVVTELGNQP